MLRRNLTALRTKLLACFFMTLSAARADFKPGHIYVVTRPYEPCDLGNNENIWEVDPKTRERVFFADSDDGLCRANSLAFTPDGQFLRVASSGHVIPPDDGWVQEFTSDGLGTIILDGSDGLNRPDGWNVGAFNAIGDYYFMNTQSCEILRFPVEGGPAEVIVDECEVNTSGSLAFAPNGDLYCVSGSVPEVSRVTPDGKVSVFDTLGFGGSMVAIDTKGTIFVNDFSSILRYDNGDAATRRVIAEPGYIWCLALSPDETQLYTFEIEYIEPITFVHRIHAVDLRTESTSIIWEYEDDTERGPHGMAVYPCPTDDPALDCNANGILDSCEVDCNGNAIPDACDLIAGSSADCNANTVPDECELDCNANGVPDGCDLADGTSSDCNANAVPDECEGGADCDGNGRLDECDIAQGSADLNGDGVPDVCQCHADVTLDGAVDPLDAGAVEARFGLDPTGNAARFDVNFDGTIDPLDAGYVLSRFGECP